MTAKSVSIKKDFITDASKTGKHETYRTTQKRES